MLSADQSHRTGGELAAGPRSFAAVLVRWWPAVLLTSAASLLTALAGSLWTAPLYEATVAFYVAEAAPPVGAYSGAVPVVAALESALLPSLRADRLRSYQGLLESEAIRGRVRAALSAEPAELGDVAVALTRHLLLQVRVRHGDAQRAAAIANAYPGAFEEFLGDIARPYEQRALEKAKAAYDHVGEELVAARAELQGFLEAAGTPDVSAAVSESVSRRTAVERELEDARASLRALEARIVAAEGRLRSQGVLREPAAEVQRSEATQQLMGQIAQLEQQRAVDGEAGRGEAALRERLDGKRRSLTSEMERLVSRTQQRLRSRADSLEEGLRRQIVESYVERAVLEAEISGKRQALGQLERRAGELPWARLQAERLRAQVERQQRMSDAAALAYEEARFAQSGDTAQIVVVQEAQPPLAASYPRPLWSALLGAALGLLAGIYLAFAAELIERWRVRQGAA